jgi:hypothetical protein
MSEQIKISQLPVLSTMTDAAVVPVVADAATQQISGSDLKTYFTGDVTFDGANISAPDDTVVRIQALDSNSVVRSYVRLDPDNGYAEMRALSGQRNTAFGTGDWATGEWTGTENDADLSFTDATDIVDFLNNEFSSTTNQTISVNGGEPMVYNGWSGGGSDVIFFVDVAPPADPTTITSIEFGYYYSSRIEIDSDDDEINIRGRGLSIDIETDESIDIAATNSVEIVSDTVVSLLNNSTTEPIIIRTDNSNTNQTWEFSASGNLTLPRGGVVYETNIPYGGLSGNTIALLPQGGTSADQQLLIYPTVGADANHLHLTSGNLYNTELFLGNDDLYVKLANTGNIVINSNDNTGNTAQWTFGINGNLSAPGNISTDGYISAGNIGVSTTITTQTLVTDPGPLSGLTLAFGARGFINDGNLAAAGNFGAQVAGGGGNSVPVWSDGANWYIG